MKINSFYSFKLTDSANKIYCLHKNINSYSMLDGVDEVWLRIFNKGSVNKCKIISKKEFQATIQLVNEKYGTIIIEESNDLLLIKKSSNKLGLLRIYVFENMKPYSAIVFQSFIDGYFNPQIRELKKSVVQ